MAYNPKQLATIVSHASHHLHAVSRGMATTMLDTSETPRMLFSNSALTQVSGQTLLSVARQHVPCEDPPPCFFTHNLEDSDRVIYVVTLDEKHVFLAVGAKQDELLVEEFILRLKKLLPRIASV